MKRVITPLLIGGMFFAAAPPVLAKPPTEVSFPISANTRALVEKAQAQPYGG